MEVVHVSPISGSLTDHIQVCNRSIGDCCSDWGLVSAVLREAEAGVPEAGVPEASDGSPRHTNIEHEIRQRLCWYIRSLDTAAVERSGLRSLSNSIAKSRIELPLHIGDEDFGTTGTLSLAKNPGWKDVTFCLVLFEIQKAKEEVLHWRSHLVEAGDKGSGAFMDSVRIHIQEKYLAYCDKNNPIQLATVFFSKVLLGDLLIQAVQAEAINVGDAGAEASLTGGQMELVLDALRTYNELLTDEFFKSFRWYLKAFPPHMLISTALRQVSESTASPTSTELWEAACQTLELTTNSINSISSLSG